MAVRITTFNLLHDGVRSLVGPWSARRPRVVRMLRRLDPDVICLQEVSSRQLEHLRHDLDDYEAVAGVASGPIVLPAWPAWYAKPAHWLLGDFFKAGEFCPILLRRSSVRRVADGTLRLPAPRPARAFTPHVVNWARVESVRSGATFEVFTTHLGILPWREGRSAGEVLDAMNGLRAHHPQVLTGDFNSRPGGALIRTLTRADDRAGFRDAWTAAERREGGGTFHWGMGLPGPRIDYVLSRPGVPVPRASVSGRESGRPWVSDHWALTVDLTLE